MTEALRIDKWLWHARFYKTRSLAQEAAISGRIRRNGTRIEKAGTEVKPGDVLTLFRGKDVIAVRVIACGVRRGPAKEAQGLYDIMADATLDPIARAP